MEADGGTSLVGERCHLLCFAWHGLPFYAFESLMALKQVRDDRTIIIATRAKGDIHGSVEELQLGVTWIDADHRCSFRDLGLQIPEVLVKTSWCHLAFESLADDVRANGGKVVLMTDTTFALTIKKLLGPLYGHLRLACRHSAVFVPGKESERYMRWCGFTPDRIFKGLYATNAERFQHSGERKRPRLLFVGRFEPEKNIDGLVAGWREYKKRGGRLEELTMIGRGSLSVRSDPAVGLQILDWASQGEIRQWMDEAQAFVLPSRLDHWGVVLLEAALSSCVLLAPTTCGAAHDLIRTGTNGFMYRGHSGSVIADSLLEFDRRMRSTDWLAAAMADARRAGERFSSRAFCDAVNRMLIAVTARSG